MKPQSNKKKAPGPRRRALQLVRVQHHGPRHYVVVGSLTIGSWDCAGAAHDEADAIIKAVADYGRKVRRAALLAAAKRIRQRYSFSEGLIVGEDCARIVEQMARGGRAK